MDTLKGGVNSGCLGCGLPTPPRHQAGSHLRPLNLLQLLPLRSRDEHQREVKLTSRVSNWGRMVPHMRRQVYIVVCLHVCVTEILRIMGFVVVVPLIAAQAGKLG
jgi:hypothetical protein